MLDSVLSFCTKHPGGEKDPSIIAEVIKQHQVTIVQFVPSMLSVFLDHFNHIELNMNCSSVRHVFSGGEELSSGLVRRFQQKWNYSGQVKLTNFYGPTEATIYVNAFDIQPNQEFVSIGTNTEHAIICIRPKSTLAINRN